MEAITKFDKQYSFLSNTYSGSVIFDGMVYRNAEAAYQAQKVTDETEKSRFTTMTPGNARYHAYHEIKVRDDWKDIRDDIMIKVVRSKFKNDPYIRKLLIETNDTPLVYSNICHDNYWGICVCDDCADIFGKNKLGVILEKIREEFKKEDLENV